MYRHLFTYPHHLLNNLGDLQNILYHNLHPWSATNIRAGSRQTFPKVNISKTANSIEIQAFLPGIAVDQLETTIDKGLLTISGERKPSSFDTQKEYRRYAEERFSGAFKRVINLPDDIDSNKVDATYENGILKISIGKQNPSEPQRIQIK